MNTEEIKLTPYLFFQGNCEEALNYYQRILNGSVHIMQRYDNPAMQAPKEQRDKVLHALFQFGSNTIFASDVFHGPAPSGISNVALSLNFPDAEIGNEVFNSLAAGGVISIPFEKQFWGSYHGNLTDKYNNRWMVNCN